VWLSFVFEDLHESDIEKCVDLMLSRMSDQPSPTLPNKEVLKRLLSGENAVTIVAKRQGKLAGVIGGTPGTLNFIATFDEESAREGLGYMLIDRFVEEVKRRVPQVESIRTTLLTENTDQVALYSRKGFVIEGFAKEYVMGRDMIFLRRKLV